MASLAVVALALTARQSAAIDPIVDTGVSELAPDGRHVAVHVPGIFNMVMDTRGPPGSHKGVRMNMSVLAGMVRVFVDRALGPSGSMIGPIEVKVSGLTMYHNGAEAISAAPPRLPVAPVTPVI